MIQRYTASASLPKGRSSWVITFRHPLKIEARTGQGLKVRRGLGTSNEKEAKRLVAEMDELLGDEAFHNIAMKQQAEHLFSDAIVNAFYDGIESLNSDTKAIREKLMPLPTAEDGYAKILLVGTTGAGKTSLLRHIIASDPVKDRFPSTSTAKTTIANLELITSQSPFKSVVTFFSEWSVRTSIRECIADSCLAVYEGLDTNKIATRLLQHRDQKFRLSYLLGAWNPNSHTLSEGEEEDDWGNEDTVEKSDTENLFTNLPSLREQANMQGLLESYTQRIREIAQAAADKIRDDVGKDFDDLGEEARAAAEERFDKVAQGQGDFDDLLNDIVDEIHKRFERLPKEQLRRRANGWPEFWTCESTDRQSFITQIRQFFSNYAGAFGQLLTPLVEGIRVQGDFQPIFSEQEYKLVLLDGQGLGHTPDSASSVTTRITKQFDDTDAILLVDNAQQPIQAAPLSVIRAIAASGYHKKLVIAFTHFDSVTGANIPRFQDKKAHVLASVTNGLRSLSETLGKPTVGALERSIESKCFMIGGLDQSLGKAANGDRRRKNRDELVRLLNFCQRSPSIRYDVDAAPVYDPDGLAFAVQAATYDFQKRWDAILGMRKLSGIEKEHWMRVRALNRRIAEKTDVEYDTLRPVADFLARLNESISQYLDRPKNWNQKPSSKEEEEETINIIRQKVFRALHPLLESRIVINPIARWISAYKLSGKGSTFRRAEEIQSIYAVAAPELSMSMTQSAKEFLDEIKMIVFEAVKDAGGRFDREVFDERR